MSLVADRSISLQLKSAAPSQSSSVQTASDAVICTQDETFEVRQVHSSNVLYILQVSRYATDDTFDASYYEGMTAIAQCKGLLELVKASPLAEQYLKVHVPTYQLEGGSMPSATHIRTRLELLDDAPFSNGEFQNACTQLCIFEIEGNPWLPTASVLKNIWTSFLSAAIVKDIDITKAFQAVTLVTLVEEDGHIGSALQAILQRIALVSKDSINDSMYRGMIRYYRLIEIVMLIDCEKCIKWLGSLLVEISGQLPVQRTSFVEEWQDLLPEAWRKHANLAKLQVRIQIPVPLPYTHKSLRLCILNLREARLRLSGSTQTAKSPSPLSMHQYLQEANGTIGSENQALVRMIK